MKRKATLGRGPDWLAAAIGRTGAKHKRAGEDHIDGSARRLKIPRATIIGWLERGPTDAPFTTVVKLSELGDVFLELLARRLGPWKFTQ